MRRKPRGVLWIPGMLAAGAVLGCPSLSEIVVRGPDAGVDAAPDRQAPDAAREVKSADVEADGCTSRPLTDPRNCGRCGHDCGRGACKGGVCQPYALVTGALKPWGVAVNCGVLYFTTLVLNVEECSVDDCRNPKQFAGIQNHAHGITTDSTSVYWANFGMPGAEGGPPGGSIATCGLAGCPAGTATALAPDETGPIDVAVDTSSVYWTDTSGQAVRSCGITGCGGSPKTLADDPTALSGIAVDPLHVYWAEPDLGNIVQCPLAGCASFAPFATGQTGAAEIDVAGDAVFWSANDAIMTCPTSGCAGGPQVFAKGQPSSFAIAHDATNLYWSLLANDGKVLSCPLAGCSMPAVLGEAEDMPSSIAVDDTSVYWADSGSGMIMRVMK